MAAAFGNLLLVMVRITAQGGDITGQRTGVPVFIATICGALTLTPSGAIRSLPNAKQR